jgi:transposase
MDRSINAQVYVWNLRGSSELQIGRLEFQTTFFLVASKQSANAKVTRGLGPLFYKGLEGRFNSDSYHAFLQMILAQTTQHLFLIHDEARYHTSASTQAFLAAHRDRLTEAPLPSCSSDYNPIEYLWKQAEHRATHNQHFKEFAALTVSVENELAYFATHPDTVLGW